MTYFTNFCIQTVLQRGKTYLHIAAQTGQSELFEAMLNEKKRLKSFVICDVN